MDMPESPGLPLGSIELPELLGWVGAGAPSGSMDMPELAHWLLRTCPRVPQAARACWEVGGAGGGAGGGGAGAGGGSGASRAAASRAGRRRRREAWDMGFSPGQDT